MKFQEMAELLQPIYEANGWQWVNPRGNKRQVPSIAKIKRTIVRLYGNLTTDKDGQSIESGRLKVTRILDEYGNTERFELALVLPWEDDDLVGLSE